jgi:hypothetical protein
MNHALCLALNRAGRFHPARALGFEAWFRANVYDSRTRKLKGSKPVLLHPTQLHDLKG